ncbi:MAG: DUF6263 family protein [Ferruginibacter sp.]
MKFTKPFSLIVTAALFCTLTLSAQTSPGKLLLIKGQKIQVDNVIKSVISQEMMGQAMEITIDASLTHQVEVKDKKKDSYLVTSTLTRLTTNGSMMGQEMKFDSDKKEDLESQAGQALKDQLNVSKEVEFNESAVLINGIKKDTAAGTGGEMMDIMNDVIGGGNDESNGANAAFEVIPAGRKVGDTWSDSSINEEIKTYRNYTLKEINGNDATVVLTGKQVTKKKVEKQGMEISVNIEGTLEGEGIIDLATGLVKQKTLVVNGAGNTEMMGQSMPVTTKITTTTTVKKM